MVLLGFTAGGLLSLWVLVVLRLGFCLVCGVAHINGLLFGRFIVCCLVVSFLGLHTFLI